MSPTNQADIKTLIETLIKENKVVVFSKTFCPYCHRVKQLFDKLGITYKVLELNTAPNGGDIQDYLEQLTGQRTVPNVFINGKHIGGCDSIMAANNSGELARLLKE